MTASSVPRVSVGLPVYNGEDYLEESIASVLGQDFVDLELVISDNASTDRTESICRKAAAEDDRVVYVRRPQNIGGGRNFNFVLELARGEYFKWMAHDDVCKPEFISRCVAALDADPSVVLAYPSPVDIDGEGNVLGPRDRELAITSDSAYTRFRTTMSKGHAVLAQFGVVRTDVLRATAQLGTYPGSDRPLLGELALHGRLLEIPEELFLHREHANRAVHAHRDDHAMLAWWDPKRTGQISLPMWRRLAAYLRAISRAPITPRDRILCAVFMVRWAVDLRARLTQDVLFAARELVRRLAPNQLR